MSDTALMDFPGRSGGKPTTAAKRSTPATARPAGVTDAWLKTNGDIGLSAGNYDTTDAFMVMSLKITDAEALHRKLGAVITKAKNKK